MDRETWWAAVHGVAQSRTRLKRLSSSSSKAWDGLRHSKLERRQRAWKMRVTFLRVLLYLLLVRPSRRHRAGRDKWSPASWNVWSSWVRVTTHPISQSSINQSTSFQFGFQLGFLYPAQISIKTDVQLNIFLLGITCI